jgi:hypothetical protein
MPNLFLTLLIAFIVIVFAIAFLAIGWLITGQTKIKRTCGRDPTKEQEDSCQSTCDLCSTDHPETKKPTDSESSSPRK